VLKGVSQCFSAVNMLYFGQVNPLYYSPLHFSSYPECTSYSLSCPSTQCGGLSWKVSNILWVTTQIKISHVLLAKHTTGIYYCFRKEILWWYSTRVGVLHKCNAFFWRQGLAMSFRLGSDSCWVTGIIDVCYHAWPVNTIYFRFYISS
jgi:hypothetical protein